MYAHHKKLEYFSTECIYSPEAFRGSARALVKNLEKIRPSAILDLVRSGEDMATLVPESISGVGQTAGAKSAQKSPAVIDDEAGIEGCGSALGRSSGGEMTAMEKRLRENEDAKGREMEVKTSLMAGQGHDREGHVEGDNMSVKSMRSSQSCAGQNADGGSRRLPKQQIGQCERCGYMSSQKTCKACMLLEGLNRNRPSRGVGGGESNVPVNGMSQVAIRDGNG